MKNSNKERVLKVLKEMEKDALSNDVMQLIFNTTVSKEESNIKDKLSFSQKAADTVANFVGSWTFVISFLIVLFSWMALNLYYLANPFDKYPFILLNLVLSCVAAIQAPLIMMSQNRQEEIDRLRAENDYKVNLKTEIVIEEIYYKLIHLENQHRETKKIIKEIQRDLTNTKVEQ